MSSQDLLCIQESHAPAENLKLPFVQPGIVKSQSNIFINHEIQKVASPTPITMVTWKKDGLHCNETD